MTDWKDKNARPLKQISRQMATDFPLRTSALFMPADQLKCVETAEQQGMISKDHTSLLLVERNPSRYKAMKRKVTSRGWGPQSDMRQQELSSCEIPFMLDYAWIDLNGAVNEDVAMWIQEELSSSLVEGAVVCLTQEYCWRSNRWLKSAREKVLREHSTFYWDFRRSHLLFDDKYIAFFPFAMSCLLRNYELEIMEPYRYSDTIDMVLFRFIVKKSVGSPTFPRLGNRAFNRQGEKSLC